MKDSEDSEVSEESAATKAKANEQGWALFDLDQTLVPYDLQLLFCDFVLKREGWRRVLLLPFVVTLPLAKVLGSEAMKRTFLCLLWRMPREELETLGEEFAEMVVTEYTYPDVLAECERHGREGRERILVSASPEVYVAPIGRRYGFEKSFGTVISFVNGKGKELSYVPWRPRFEGGNNKGARKVERLEEELSLSQPYPNSEGYSDSKVDLPMLEGCQRVVAIHPEGEYASRAEAEGWRILRPKKPWEDRRQFAGDCLLMLLGVFRS